MVHRQQGTALALTVRDDFYVCHTVVFVVIREELITVKHS